ncbi:MAG: hypothetical protein JRI89_17205, partial [Deltaproteobacteria bacterium]|nr:hypothetical protein [Deltaproteobacteria bacterium]
IPPEYDVSSILALADFILSLEFAEFLKIAVNLPLLVDGIILQDKTASLPEAEIDLSWETTIEELSRRLPDEIDLTDSSQDRVIFAAATDLLNDYPDISTLQNLDQWLTSSPESFKDAMLLVAKLALSRIHVKRLAAPLHVSVVLAMYNEHNRILPKSDDNPSGEDFVRRKVKQMEWLLQDSPASFALILVDDGCPKQSGKIAQQIIESEGYRNVKLLHLEDAIKCQLPIVSGIKTTSDSRKGGSIQYGMWQALQDYTEGDNQHVVVFTDADMAAPLNEIGLLLGKLDDKTMVAIGSRYDAGSVCRGPWGKNGKVQGLTDFDRLMVGLRSFLFSKLFPQTGHITDTQCGLKCFKAELLRTILPKTQVRTFSFDIELLLLAAAAGSVIASVPIYWHDSLAESNFWRQAAASEAAAGSH